MNILFVCTGNTCRSPMAEAIFRHKHATFNVQSAGIYANHYDKANPLTVKVLEENGIQIEHLSQPVTTDLLGWADYVFTMTNSHKQQLILQQYNNDSSKVHVLKQFVEDPDNKLEDELEKAYEDFKLKEGQLREKHDNLTEDELIELINRKLIEELTHIYSLQERLKAFDISDPFGGTSQHYEKTYEQLYDVIYKLIRLL